jgi:hypothetical protein
MVNDPAGMSINSIPMLFVILFGSDSLLGMDATGGSGLTTGAGTSVLDFVGSWVFFVS